jgi:very-short-patch-repair endonuclease
MGRRVFVEVQHYDAVLPQIALSDLVAQIGRLGHGERLSVVGIGCDGIADALRSQRAPSRSALILALNFNCAPEAVLDQILDDLAELALAHWPRWYGYEAPTTGSVVTHATSIEQVSRPWLCAAVKRASAGHRPRLRKAAKRLEFAQLMLALDPPNPILIASIDAHPIGGAAGIVQALEWCVAQGASVVAAFPSRPPFVPPYDRILYGAIEVVRPSEPVQCRFIAPVGRPHPASLVEQRVEAALRADPELASLFLCNQTIVLDSFGTAPRVDLLWREGRVVVELDGPEHRSDPKFAYDRHRDYELLVAGYLVLRITNDQVETDLPRAIEKIRAVVQSAKRMRGVDYG